MNKPLLILITGAPASGKTTLTHLLSKEMRYPFLSRDELKEGYIHTIDKNHSQLNNSVAWHIYETFFEAIDLLISKGISLIVEAAFQDKLWKQQLFNLTGKAEMKIIICKTNPDKAKIRFANRLSNDPGRERFHGDSPLDLIGEQGNSVLETYEPLNMDIPTLEVDTTENYNPDIEKIFTFLKQRNSR